MDYYSPFIIEIKGQWIAMEAMKKDYTESNGQCNLALIEKDVIFNPMVSWGVTKDSPYREALNMW